MASDATRQQKLIRVGISFAIFVVSSLYFYYRDTSQTEKLNALFNDTLFAMPGVSTELSAFSASPDGVAIDIIATGLPNPATEYKPYLLAFVCSQPSFKKLLLSGKSIDFDMRAPDRLVGSHVNMQIDAARCHYRDQ
jgi:hypothetical protein